MSVFSEKSPFKFLNSYKAADKDIFFGRERETEEIYSKVFQSNMLLVYGASGTGKSSLINCGLANKFQETDWLPIHIRRGGNINRSMYTQISKHWVTPVASDEADTEDLIHRSLSSLYLDYFKPIYLIFDQFEELFIFGNPSEWQEFIQTVRHLLDSDLQVKFIFVIRGEYLEFLSEFEDTIPHFFDNRLRVEKMTRRNAMSSITGPAQLFSIQLDEQFEENLIKKLSPEKSQIELTFLQVFLDKIYKRAIAERKDDEDLFFSNRQIESLGEIEDVLAEFLDEQLFLMEDSKSALAVLKSFVSRQGTKVPRNTMEVRNLSADFGAKLSQSQVDEVILELVNRRILKDKDDSERYELIHDSLALKVYEKITLQEREVLDIKQFLQHSYEEFQKRGTLLNDEDLVYIQANLKHISPEQHIIDYIAKSENQSVRRRKQRRTRNIVLALIVLLLITSIMGFVYSIQQRAKAEELAQIALNESEEAKRQKEIADKNRQEAEANAIIADTNAGEAERQKDVAIEQRMLAAESREEAVKQAQIANQERLRAESEKSEAERQRLIAQENEKQAITLKEQAETAETEAYRLRSLSLSRSLAIRSLQQQDDRVKTLLAIEAYQMNLENGGYLNQADVYLALLSAYQLTNQGEKLSVKVHNDAIIAFLPVDDQIVSVSEDGKLISHTLPGIKSTQNLFFDAGSIIKSAFATEERILIGSNVGEISSLDTDGTRIWNTKVSAVMITDISQVQDRIFALSPSGNLFSLNAEGEVIGEYTIPSGLRNITPMQSKQLLLTGDMGIMGVWNEASQSYSPLQGVTQEDILSSLYLPEVNKIVMGLGNGKMLILDSNYETEVILSAHTTAVTDLSYDTESHILVSSGRDRSVTLREVGKWDQSAITVTGLEGWQNAVFIDPIEQQLIAGGIEGHIQTIPRNMIKIVDELKRQEYNPLSDTEWIKYVGEDVERIDGGK